QRVARSFRRAARSYNRLVRRLREQLEARGRGQEFAELSNPWAAEDAVAPLLERGELAQAVKEYDGLRTSYDGVSQWLLGLEYGRLERWRGQAAGPGGAKPKLAVVTVSGGANRSALWTVFVLDTLECELGAGGRPFAPHVRLITGASGGMVGASYWVATLD